MMILRLRLQAFLSAFLLFLIQPLFATQWTPFFGGSASVWSLCLFAFQFVLMIGYALALLHIPKKIHILLLVLAWLWYVFIAYFKLESFCLALFPTASPTFQLFQLFFWHICPIYLILSLTSPYLQNYYFHQIPKPEQLFAYSNLGSILALLSFPFLTSLGLSTINQLYNLLCLILICLFLLNLTQKSSSHPQPLQVQSDHQKQPFSHQLAILFYATLGSALLIASTQTVSQDLGAHPFLWTLFLCAYLLSHVLTFAFPLFQPQISLLILSLCGLLYILNQSYHASLYSQTFGIALGIMVICWHIHQKMLSFMPKDQKKGYAYLIMSIGGTLGGLIAGPFSFSFFEAPYELHFFLMIWTITLMITKLKEYQHQYQIQYNPLVLSLQSPWRIYQILLLIALIPLQYELFTHIQKFKKQDAISYRNFYGYLQIRKIAKKGQPEILHLLDGRISHGFQWVGSDAQLPTAYFAPQSGIGQTFALLQSSINHPLDVSIIGLGIGTLSAYAKNRDHFQFFEINPAVIQTAQSHFSFVSGAQQRGAKISMWEGDGRQKIKEVLGDHSQDLIVLDAFSGDAPPPHLITWQAMGLYLDKIKKNGVIAMNVSNIHLNLKGIVVALMQRFELQGKWVRYRAHSPLGEYLSDWVILSLDRDILQGIDGEWVEINGKGIDWGDEGGAIWGGF